MTRDAWLTTHPYLRSVAEMQESVERAADILPAPEIDLPNWDNYSADFLAGVPLLYSPCYKLDIQAAARMIESLTKALASERLPGNFAVEIRALSSELSQYSSDPRQAIMWLLGKGTIAPDRCGLLRFLGWTALRRYLQPLLEAFRNWRPEERWLRSYCPTCGSPPAMAQLIGVDPGRLRYFSCGYCGTCWRYRRTGCPFCKIEDDHRLASMAIEGEGGLRIDYCQSCGSYLKTYDGVGNETVLLADWTSLHLDVLARDRGWRRLATSLYEI